MATYLFIYKFTLCNEICIHNDTMDSQFSLQFPDFSTQQSEFLSASLEILCAFAPKEHILKSKQILEEHMWDFQGAGVGVDP